MWTKPFRSRRAEKPVCRHARKLTLEALEDRWLPSTFAVTNTNDSGLGSLRQAILSSNATSGTNTIDFSIGGGGVQTISPLSGLPNVTVPVVLDGTSQPGFAGSPLIVLDGTNAGAGAAGLWITAGNSAVQDLVIDHFPGNGVLLQTRGGNVLTGNYIGIDVTGAVAAGNGSHGVAISAGSGSNVVGGTTAAARNVISANALNAVALFGGASGNVIQGSYLGTDAGGTVALGNGYGVGISGASNNTVGGTAAGAGNVISGNVHYGVAVFGSGTTGNLVQGNYIGTDVSGTVALGNGNQGVAISAGASNNTVGGTAAGARNLISGNAGNAVILFGGVTGNRVEGNYVGTDITGTQALGNGFPVDLLDPGTSNNTIGGTAAGAGNLISGNANNGLAIDRGASGNVVQGNLIGTDVTGTQALGNGLLGVYVLGGAHDNIIGGTTAAAGNLISGNADNGVAIFSNASGNVVQGNLIGTDVTGTLALGNGGDGVVITDAANGNLIGGTAAGARNVISGNAFYGVSIFVNVTSNVVQGNYIGTDLTGTVALGNTLAGVHVRDASNTTIGGTTPGARNLISGNAGNGVELVEVASGTTGTVVQGNYIGTDVSGTNSLGNGGNGVYIAGADSNNNLIGGTSTGAANTIAYNGNDGVLVDTATGNTILNNLIFSSGNLGIELTNGGNNNQPAPTLTSATSNGSSTTVQGTLTSTPNTTFTLQFFANPVANASGAGEGQQLLGSVTVTTDASGFASFTFTFATAVPAGQFVSATATDSGGNTSQFAQDVTVSSS